MEGDCLRSGSRIMVTAGGGEYEGGIGSFFGAIEEW